MSACPDQMMLLGGLLDGELDAANTALVEAHVARCSGCREELERQQAVRNLIASGGVRHSAPQSLRQRVAAAIPELSPAPRRAPNRVLGWLPPAAGGALAASLAMLLLVQPPSQAALEQQLISSHVRSLQPGHLTDVQTTNQHIVKPWFNGKIDFSPPVPELADQGFPLAGGRLDSIDGKTVAAIVYHRRLHTVNLFVWPGASGPIKTSTEEGFEISEWSENGLRFAAVSDIPPQELAQFEQVFRARTQSGVTAASVRK
ncbi:MAG TPA: zf-HC2 domain-containing protein [Sphingomicrobium sp.]|jgi:mycothiol system anti-sigma-R factor|nr:zf-HC2 domain-containing protein [Sphingomicrobium sp.]